MQEREKTFLHVPLLMVAQDFHIRSICRETCLKAEGGFRKLERLQGLSAVDTGKENRTGLKDKMMFHLSLD